MAQHTHHAPSPRRAPARPQAWHEAEPHPHQHLSSAHGALGMLLWAIRGILCSLLCAGLSHHFLGTTPTGGPITTTALFLTFAFTWTFCCIALATAWRRDRRRARHLTAFLYKA